MKFIEKIKNYPQAQTIKSLLNIFFTGSFSKENLIKMTYLAEKITAPEVKFIAAELRKLFEKDHPCIQLAYKVYHRLSKQVRNRFIENFIVNALLRGETIRRSYLEKEGFMAPLLLVISPTMQCNLNCKGCYAGAYEKNYGLSYELVSDIINQAKELGIYFITLSGGEVFIREDIIKNLFREHKDVYFQIYTNGTLITKEIADDLADVGNVALLISIEGFQEQTDKRRGKGVFSKILETMRLLKDRGIIFGYSATVTTHNLDVLTSDELVELMINEGCMLGYYFLYLPIGRQPNMKLMVTPEQRNNLRERVWRIRDTKPIFLIDFWNDGPWVEGCIAGGRYYLHINSNGDAEPCVFCHFAKDNIKEKSLKEILKSPFFKRIKEKQPFSENHLAPCMIIDNPHVLRELYEEYELYPTHEGAESLIYNLKEEIDKYSQTWHRLTEPLFKQIFQKAG
jgi:MoaA/NifB/PqqE/SkfB family radical SAM enzyme